MTLRRTGIALPVVTLFLLAGCLGSASPIHVAPEAIETGWSHTVEDDKQTVAADRVEIIINKYARGGDLQGEIYLVAVTKVPFVNEQKHIREQVEEQAAGSGVTMVKERSFDRTLDNGQAVEITEYSITKQVGAITAAGHAWFVAWDTSGFAAGGIAWATTEHQTLLGKQSNTTAWEQAQRMVMAAEW